jgi:hypothetical protein
MRSNPIKLLGHAPDSNSDEGERRSSTKTWLAVAATAALALGMFFIQACTDNAKAGPNGGDVVALSDGKTRAEVLANADTGEVMVHTWDRDLKSSHPVDARPLMIGTDTKQLQLEPHPLASDPPGYCSRFYGRADWLEGGNVRHGWISQSSTPSERHDFQMNRGWKAGAQHGGMWSEMGGHGPGMGPAGHGGMRH